VAKSTIDRFRRETARQLRLDQTDAEARLWRRLRHWPMDGTHFRRQVPIGPYVVDFACMAARLAIELDGSQHGEDENILRDEARTRWLEAAGYRVIRFWNNDLISNMDGVLESIYAAVHGASNAEPSPFKHKRRPRTVAAPGVKRG
jgi:very-short-patch-repair endonuclease